MCFLKAKTNNSLQISIFVAIIVPDLAMLGCNAIVISGQAGEVTCIQKMGNGE